jgi:hypothetical protein
MHVRASFKLTIGQKSSLNREKDDMDPQVRRATFDVTK